MIEHSTILLVTLTKLHNTISFQEDNCYFTRFVKTPLVMFAFPICRLPTYFIKVKRLPKHIQYLSVVAMSPTMWFPIPSRTKSYFQPFSAPYLILYFRSCVCNLFPQMTWLCCPKQYCSADWIVAMFGILYEE